MIDGKKDPAFLFYPGDWMQSETVRAMTYEQRGVYLELLAMAWLEGSIPEDPERLRRMVGLSAARWAKVWPLISECWEPREGDSGRLVNPRQEHERVTRREKAEEMRRRGAAGGKQSAKQRASSERAGDAA